MSALPEEHVFSHQYCFFLHDRLVSILKGGGEAGIFSAQLHVATGEPLPPEDLSGESLFQWLELNGHKDVIFSLYYRQICAALVADFLNFTFEALSCSAKGKLTVAYALLRKPFKENLFFLEWLLADPNAMLKAFEGGHETKSINRFSDSDKKNIIALALAATGDSDYFSADLIYNIRYNKNFPDGFEPLFQKANHLVTTFRFMETEAANFNFVFSDEDSWDSQWAGLYSSLPVLLFHTVQVVEAIISTFAQRRSGVDLTSVRALIGLALWFQRRPHPIDGRVVLQAIAEALREISCPGCGRSLDDADDHLEELYAQNRLRCNECGWACNLNELETDPLL